MSYRVIQSLDTLGNACEITCETLQDAEEIADKLRRKVIRMVSSWDVMDSCEFEVEEERQVWEEAAEMAHTSGLYGREAAQYIAECAVRIVDDSEEEELLEYFDYEP